MPSLLIKHAVILVTMDDHRREIPDGGLFIRDGFIVQVGPTGELPLEADEILDLSGYILLPGLINTHHHFYADPGCAGCSGCQSFQLVENPLPNLGTDEA